MQLGKKTDPPLLPLQHSGKKPMALRKHIVQPATDKSAVHCARLYNVCELVNFSSSVANFLAVPEFAALSTAVVIARANKSLKRSASVTVCELFNAVEGTMPGFGLKAELSWYRIQQESYQMTACFCCWHRLKTSLEALLTHSWQRAVVTSPRH